MTTNGNEPLTEVWTERNRLVALVNAANTDPEIDAAADKLSAIEHQIANTEARGQRHQLLVCSLGHVLPFLATGKSHLAIL